MTFFLVENKNNFQNAATDSCRAYKRVQEYKKNGWQTGVSAQPSTYITE